MVSVPYHSYEAAYYLHVAPPHVYPFSKNILILTATIPLHRLFLHKGQATERSHSWLILLIFLSRGWGMECHEPPSRRSRSFSFPSPCKWVKSLMSGEICALYLHLSPSTSNSHSSSSSGALRVSKPWGEKQVSQYWPLHAKVSLFGWEEGNNSRINFLRLCRMKGTV